MTTDPITPLLVPDGTPLDAGKMYLHLYHGRRAPDQEMNDWGFPGPTFGPLSGCVQTYRSTVRVLAEQGDEEIWLDTRDDLVVFDGRYYGDVLVFVAAPGDLG